MAYEEYCAACTYMGEQGDYDGKYWCDKKGERRFASDPKCYGFCEAYSRGNSARENMISNSQGHQGSGCYLTTIMCKLLNYPDNNYYLDTLRGFRDNVMKKNPKYYSLLLTYDIVGPMIAYELAQDKNGKVIATTFFSNYITKAVSAIEEEKYDNAINIYTAMTDTLANHYNINTNIISPDITQIDTKYLGHGKVKRRVNNI